jgi:hypothetical protein
MMSFSGDNITFPNSNPNIVFNQATNSISTPLQNNLELNVSLPNSEKLKLNNGNDLNVDNNIGVGYLSKIGIGDLPIRSINRNLVNFNQMMSNNLVSNNFNIDNITNNNLIPNDTFNIGLIGNNHGLVNSNLNSSLLPQPIPIQLDKNLNMGIPINGQAILTNSIGIIKISY